MYNVLTATNNDNGKRKMTSPTPSQTENNTTTSCDMSSTSSSSGCEATVPAKCSICHELFQQPRVLPCLHTFCLKCIEKTADGSTRLCCPDCGEECHLPNGASALLPDVSIGFSDDSNSSLLGGVLHCTGCKNPETNAIARCIDCSSTLCSQCVNAHRIMHCFDGHRISSLEPVAASSPTSSNESSCEIHPTESLSFFCRQCSQAVCDECVKFEHRLHDYDYLTTDARTELDVLQSLAQQAKAKATDLRSDVKSVEHSLTKLNNQYKKAQADINETYNFYRSILDGRREEALRELDAANTQKQGALNAATERMTEITEKLYQAAEFIERLTRCANMVEVLMFKKLLDVRLQNLIQYTPEVTNNVSDLEFVSNYQAIQVGVRNTFGYIRQTATDPMQRHPFPPQPPISKPVSRVIAPPNPVNPQHPFMSNGNTLPPTIDNSLGLSSNRFPSTHSLGSLSNSTDSHLSNGIANGLNQLHESLDNQNSARPYEKWSSGNDLPYSSASATVPTPVLTDPMMDLTAKLITANIYPPRSQIKRHKMIYHCKFGEFGVMDGQFTEPSGVAVNAQNDIVVADTNNHRIQIFDREGRFKFQFGECGKRDGQLLYPNRVAVVKSSGDIVVTERSPTHQIQIYNQYGQFMRKFGASVLQHPRGVTVDSKGRIVIVECKVMRVIIFDLTGNVLRKFSCSKYLEFPNGVVVNDQDEIFISDNRAHCVKVFDYNGMYLRQVGGEGVTNYPIGVGINSAGEILIADNHNNFNITIFSQDGTLLNALESKVKHAQCFDVALMDDGSVVLASKDYRLYIYRYAQVPSLA
ncbi:DgyrCDS7965 [Dimorphilus gyrociliatus]|uniref:DgyrCDS7965 n=1 Tax=Dimorphilus gyrociliatus TaxID=2664684 RepID=A0A7I8VUZ9_9ANNE|nr:DgyrCDS7965 [Dimorphilus gyrociliatus]